MALATHRIRRQRWLCSAGSPAEAFALRGGLRDAQEAAVPAAFERAFDAAVRGDEVVRLPRLELRIRLASVDDLAAALPELLTRAVGEQLGRLLAPQAFSQTSPQMESSPHPDGPVAAAARSSGRESRLAGLIEYLATGILPWELAQAEVSALLEQFRETVSADLAAIVARAPDAQASLSRRIAFFFRLFQLLPEKRWEETALLLSLRLPVEQVGAGRASTGGPSYGLLKALTEALSGPAAQITAPHCRDAPRGVSEAAAGFPTATKRPRGIGDREPQDTAAETPHGASLQWGGTFEASFQAAASEPLRPVSSLGGAAVETFPTAVRCAGLVLLHPFLPRLFESVGLLRAGEPGLPWPELPRAAALLHWLATGRDEVHEFELGFVKILLGRRPEEPLLVEAGLLTAADREEGEALLQAAVQHWRALKGTTPAGLRASFLQRGGLLREDDAGWRLQVEPAAFDLLLDHLPWGIGVVKLPWMTRPIFTDWPTP